MKTRNIFYLALAFMALSCAKEIAPEGVAPEQDITYVQKTFTAGIGEVEDVTKTTMVNGFQIEWKANDGVTVIDNVAKKAVMYTASTGGATTTLTTTTDGVAKDATEFYAAYPWRDGDNALKLVNGDELDMCYLTPDQRPSRNSYYATAHYAMAKSDKMDNFQFKNVNAFIRFTISEDLNELVKAVYIFSNNDEEISGAFRMKWNDGNPKFVYKSDSSLRTFVRAYNSNGSGLKTGNYFLSILPTTFEKGFTMILQMLDGTQLYKRTEKKITVAEGQILPMKALNKADYSTDDVNYFVLYNEGLNVTIGGVTINPYFKDAKGKQICTIVTKNRNESVRGQNVFFITPSADEAVISGTQTNYAAIGMYKNQRSKVTQSGHMGVLDGGNVYMFANLEVTHGDVSLVRGFPSKFGNIVINNCAFKTLPRHLLDMHNGTTYDNTTLESVVIEDSEFCFVNCPNDYSILQRSNKYNMHLGTFKFVNNIVTSTGESKFRLMHGYSTNTNTGTTVTDWTVTNNTFHNTSSASFMSVAGLEDEYYCSYNLFVVPLTKSLELLTVYQPGETRIDPQSGECVNNYFYSSGSDEFVWNRGSKYQTNLSRAGSPVKLSVSPLSSIWSPAEGKFGAYSFKLAGEGTAPAYNEVGAQRADMVPATAALDSPAANYVSVELGSY